MDFYDRSIPIGQYERGMYLQNLLVARATGGSADTQGYEFLRRFFLENPHTQELLPRFVRTSRDLSSFWAWIKGEASSYEERRRLIRAAFVPLLDRLEGRTSAPLDTDASATLAQFDADGVHSVWLKALERRETDPEGAITVARTLLESVCKHILEHATRDISKPLYDDKDDLPKLYGAVAKELNIAAGQHSEEAFRGILGGCTSVVEGLGTLRNKVSDAHGRGKRSVRPQARHAKLAVNLAGAMATFLIETWNARTSAG